MAELVRRHREERLSFARVTCFLLDEYVGIPADHRCAYRRFVRDHLVAHVDVRDDRIDAPDGLATDLEAEAQRYEDAITAASGIDLQLLGLGRNGHIGFNEPGSSLAGPTRIKTLTESTRRANARFFPTIDDVPRHVLTQGIGTILRARHLLLVATGESKADAVAHTVEGPITATVPGSALQLHPHVTVVLDAAAASRLRRADDYRETFANKPAWQRH